MRFAAHFLYVIIPSFSSVRDYVPVRFSFAGDVAAPWTSDAMAINKGASIVWTQVHAITIKARALKGTK